MSPPVILCCPARNELHNLTRMVPVWSMYCDHIVVADQGSTDGSLAYLHGQPKVVVVANTDSDYNEPHRAALLLGAARELSRGAVLLFLDADETLSATVLGSPEWQRFVQCPPGTAGFFRWVYLCDSPSRYIARGSGAPLAKALAFIDDGRAFDDTAVMHGPRGPGLAHPARSFHFHEVVALHFFLTNPNVYRKKQNWYKHFWLRRGGMARGGRYFHTNRVHSIHDAIGDDRIETCPARWLAGFTDAGLDITSSESPEVMWYDVEILRGMAQHGVRDYWLLDIWNQDWERTRLRCIELGHTGMPAQPIATPPRWMRAYTSWTMGRLSVRRGLAVAGAIARRRLLP